MQEINTIPNFRVSYYSGRTLETSISIMFPSLLILEVSSRFNSSSLCYKRPVIVSTALVSAARGQNMYPECQPSNRSIVPVSAIRGQY